MIALVRHGETDWNVLGRIQGVSDIPLNATGRLQAADTAERLAMHAATGRSTWVEVVSSPLLRARETAQIIADRLDLPLGAAYPEWSEQDYGIGEGMIAEELWVAWPNWDQPGKEHDDDVVRRGLAALDRLHADFNERDVIVVAHGNIIRYPLDHLRGRRSPDLANGSVSIVERLRGTWQVSSLEGDPAERHPGRL